MLRSVFAAILLSLSAGAVAQNNEFSYSYLQLSYTQADFDNLAGTGDGIGIKGSIGITPNIHLFGGYAGLDVADNADTTGWNIGMGVNTPLSDLMDVYVRLSWQSTEVPVPGPTPGTNNDDGLGFGGGLRVGANEWIEVYGGLTYLDIESGNETVFDIGFLLNLNDTFSVGVSTAFDDNASSWSVDGRLYFD